VNAITKIGKIKSKVFFPSHVDGAASTFLSQSNYKHQATLQNCKITDIASRMMLLICHVPIYLLLRFR